MTNYLFCLPEEILDIIFYHVGRNPHNNKNNVFVRFEYIINPVPRKIYYEYYGDMSSGKPHGRGTMTVGSNYETIAINFTTNVSTQWLYKPFLYTLRNNYRLNYSNSQYLVSNP